MKVFALFIAIFSCSFGFSTIESFDETAKRLAKESGFSNKISVKIKDGKMRYQYGANSLLDDQVLAVLKAHENKDISRMAKSFEAQLYTSAVILGIGLGGLGAGMGLTLGEFFNPSPSGLSVTVVSISYIAGAAISVVGAILYGNSMSKFYKTIEKHNELISINLENRKGDRFSSLIISKRI